MEQAEDKMSDKGLSRLVRVPYVAEGCTFDAFPSFINNQLPWFEILSPEDRRHVGVLNTIPQDLVSIRTNYQLVIKGVSEREGKSPIIRLNQRLSRGNCVYLSIDRYAPKYKALVGKFQDYFVNLSEEKIHISQPKELVGKLAFVLITSIGRNHSYAAARLLNVVPDNEKEETMRKNRYRIIPS